MSKEKPFYADGRAVFRRPKKTKTGMSMGFKLLTIEEFVSDGAAEAVANALNDYEERNP